ncbi:hypothetical protein COCON_G00062980 [Conger conger]|uniref:Chemokine interleukin-8-like domain-containing protein n=1 Tax=Conger conger TaxID=82655 RepID=A0A9Q1DRR0_CONCO|nr:C-C motif chemokine 20-like [Conger conger]KAJ8279232.1 hypothetical protein COCON_G00062980 [Conger conger]
MVSTRFIAVTLLVVFILQTFLLQTESASCCLSYAKKTPMCHRMKGFTIQTNMRNCDMDAIIFHTKAGKFICADPSKKLTQITVKCLNRRAMNLS